MIFYMSKKNLKNKKFPKTLRILFNLNVKMADKNIPSTSSGRPMHSGWFGYEKTYINNRPHAKCMNCSSTLSNTAKARLEKHR